MRAAEGREEALADLHHRETLADLYHCTLDYLRRPDLPDARLSTTMEVR